MKRIRVGVLGAGAWARNHLRVLSRLEGCELAAVADVSPAARARVAAEHPGVALHASARGLLADPSIHAVVVATPSPTHARLATEAMRAGKDAYVEKPLALSEPDARRVAREADRLGRVLQVGHLYEYHPGFMHVRQLTSRGGLGRVLYAYAQRLNLGVIRRHENALWSLAPHDVAMMLTLFGAMPRTVSARGGAYVQRSRHDVAFATLVFPGGGIGHIHVSWLDPHKTRRLTVVGDRRMAVFDDMAPVEKVRVYEKRAVREDHRSFGEFIGVHSGNVRIPRLPPAEPLREAVSHFLAAVRRRSRPRTDGASGVRVVHVLQAAQEALETGRTVRVS